MGVEGSEEEIDIKLELGPDFTNCQSLRELTRRVSVLGSVKGSSQTYSRRDIIAQINQVRQLRDANQDELARAILRTVTSTGGLRDAVDKWAIPGEAL